MIKTITIMSLMALQLSACDQGSPFHPTTTSLNKKEPPSTSYSNIDQALHALIKQKQLDHSPLGDKETPSIHSPKAQLGKQLFFSRNFSGDHLLACADCHNPLLAGTDRRILSTGMVNNRRKPDYYFHKADHITPPRNAPSTFNIALWEQYLYHDGRSEHSDQSGQLPLVRQSELLQRIPDEKHQNLSFLKKRITTHLTEGEKNFLLNNSEQWLEAFKVGFNAPDGSTKTLLTPKNTASALAEYMRSQVFIHSPWQAYAQGQYDAISETAKQGALLFFRPKNEGGFACASCHSGSRFTDEKFHNTQLPNINLQNYQQSFLNELDYGRGFVTQSKEDYFKFRTPSLLNVAETGPWGHNGAYRTLSSVVRHMLNPTQALRDYDAFTLSGEDLLMSNPKELQAQIKKVNNQSLETQRYQSKEIQALIAFLHTLTDPCVKKPTCLAPWLPDGFVTNP